MVFLDQCSVFVLENSDITRCFGGEPLVTLFFGFLSFVIGRFPAFLFVGGFSASSVLLGLPVFLSLLFKGILKGKSVIGLHMYILTTVSGGDNVRLPLIVHKGQIFVGGCQEEKILVLVNSVIQHGVCKRAEQGIGIVVQVKDMNLLVFVQ